MSLFGKNIRKIRKVKNLSQSGFAKLFDLTRASVGSYEEGRAEPRIDTLLQIADYFYIPIEDIVNKELTANDIHNYSSFKVYDFSSDTERKKFYGNQTVIPYIAKDKIQEYIENYQNTEFLDTLPYISLPFPNSTITMAFEHTNSAMVFNEKGIYPGDIIFCARLKGEILETIKPGGIYALITGDTLYLRRLIFTGWNIMLYPDNPNFEEFSVSRDDIKQIWLPLAKMSYYLDQNINYKMYMENLEYRVQQLEHKHNK